MGIFAVWFASLVRNAVDYIFWGVFIVSESIRNARWGGLCFLLILRNSQFHGAVASRFGPFALEMYFLLLEKYSENYEIGLKELYS